MNIPRLRFLDFKVDGINHYKEYTFSDLFVFSIGKNIKQSEASPEFNIPCVRYGELYHLYNEVIFRVVNRTNIDESELLFSEGNEILLPSAGEDPLDIGSASALTIPKIAIGRTINILKPKEKDVYNPIYVSYYINQQLKLEISKLAKGVSISNVYNSDLKKLNIKLPSLPEQQKIADFLTAVDKRIELLEKKKTLLETYKKGVMKKIFNQEIRFKDDNGNDFPDWEEKKVIEICEVKVGGTPSTSKPEYWEGEIPWINSGEIKDGIIIEPSRYITDLGLKRTSTYLLPKGTSVLAMTGATLGKMGLLSFSSTANQSVAGFVTDPITSKFIFYNFIYDQKQILSKAGGAAQKGVNKNTIENFDIRTPCSEEQVKISEFLSSIDNQIELLEIQIDKSKTWKKGLLQKMFV
jgi:type I restriction enzyme S subunit